MSPPASGQRASFFPKAEAAVLQSSFAPPSADSRPTATAPVFDVENACRALHPWSVELARSVYPESADLWAPSPVPDVSQCAVDRYLFPVLTRNERMRLTMLFYYTRGALDDDELMSRIQDKVRLAKDTIGWEFVIAGLLNHNTYTRMVTVGLPLAVLPRRESTCAHTVNQPPGRLFTMLNMIHDWRFQESPHVKQGGLRAYAGVPLCLETEFGDHVALGSLCVASNSEQEPLSKAQQTSLARLADWIVSDIIHSARARRQRERRRMLELLSDAQKQCDGNANMEEVIVSMLRDVYPLTAVSIQRSQHQRIVIGATEFPISDIEHGLWEDCEQFEDMIENMNHEDLISSRAIRAITAHCASQSTPTYLVVGSFDFRLVFDDVDSWFVHMSSTILCRYWQSRALQEALTAKENFLRGITHQLRTPIHGILGSIELLTEELKSRNVVSASATSSSSSPFMTPDVEQLDPYLYIRTIRTSARELISTVNSLIKLNQWADIANADRSVEMHSIGAIETALLNEMTQFSLDTRAEPCVIFQRQLSRNCDMMAIDLRLFLDSVQPLVVNAIQNTAQGVVAVTISIDNDCQLLTVDIEDTGCGISLKNQQRIFGAYEKVDVNTTEAGLGLTLASKSAELMNGRVTLVSSDVSKGSHFRAVFMDPICACSAHLPRSMKDRFPNIPPAFHRIHLDSQTLTATHYLSKSLVSNGFIESKRSESLLLLLDYTSNLARLHKEIQEIGPAQVGLCLVPDVECIINFGNERIKRENNVIYAKSPFLPITLEEILSEVSLLFTELAKAKSDVDSLPPGTVSIEPFQTDLTAEVPPIIEHQGSTFPTADRTALAQSLEALRITPFLAPIQPTKPMTLLVDDNAINLRLLQMYCNRRGFPCCTATDGEQAVRTFLQCRAPRESLDSQASPSSHRPIELILMDLQMPICNGIESTRRIRELEQKLAYEKCVIVMITGQDSPSDRADSQDAGTDGYLVKPVGPKALDKWVDKWFPDANVR